MSKHSAIARELFGEGYNCAQAVFVAFSDDTKVDRETALLISSSFGGGMGRLREVCGALTGAFMAAGILFGYTDSKDDEHKAMHYELIQELARKFKEENDSIICRELLGIDVQIDNPVPDKRNKEYYQKRPCADLVESGARILEEYIESQKRR